MQGCLSMYLTQLQLHKSQTFHNQNYWPRNDNKIYLRGERFLLIESWIVKLLRIVKMILLDFKLVYFLWVMIWRLSHEVGWLGFKKWLLEILIIFSNILMLLRSRKISSVWMLTHGKWLDWIFPEPKCIMSIWKVLRPDGLTKIMIRLIVKASRIIKRIEAPLIGRVIIDHIMIIAKSL